MDFIRFSQTRRAFTIAELVHFFDRVLNTQFWNDDVEMMDVDYTDVKVVHVRWDQDGDYIMGDEVVYMDVDSD